MTDNDPRARLVSDAPNLNPLWARLVVEEFVRAGVVSFSVCPGSRSTPLVWAIASNPAAETVVHYDERGAAFHALGVAKATRRPAAFVCTSGSAVANAFPAVVEASMGNVPLILLTADRPPELQDAGANQTIPQVDIFGSYTRWRYDFSCPDPKIPLTAVLTTVDQAAYRAVGPPAGPVHLNCMYREPLEPDEEDLGTSAKGIDDLSAWMAGDGPYTRYADARRRPSDDAIDTLNAALSASKRGLALVGPLASKDEQVAAGLLIEALGWPTYADPASGLRFGAPHPCVIPHADRLIHLMAPQDLDEPDCVLHLGGPLVSKAIGLYASRAAKNGAVPYIHVSDDPARVDPHHVVSLRLTADLRALSDLVDRGALTKADDAWVKQWQTASTVAENAIGAFLDTDKGLSEMTVARLVTREVPDDHGLFLGSSMPIRDADMFGSRDGHGPSVCANRGASGIDGGIATAAGYARGSKRPVTAVLGDLATLHDLNSLALLRDDSIQVVLIALNNDGGGIFSFLPIAERDQHFEPFFGTPHGMTLESFAHGFGLPYSAPATPAEFLEAYREALQTGPSHVIEVRTDRVENKNAHQAMDTAIADALKRT